MKNILLLLTTLLFIGSVFAQKNFEGQIEYEITYEDMAPELKAQESMLPKKMTTQIKGEFSKTIQPSIAGDQVSITNNKTNESLVLINIMGQKLAIKTTKEDFENSRKEQEEALDIEYLDEEKVILGYNCKKAIIKTSEADLTVYYTNELPSMAVSDQVNQIDGFPLQIIMNTEMMTHITTAKSVAEKSIDISMEVPEGYTVKTLEEFQKMFGGGL